MPMCCVSLAGIYLAGQQRALPKSGLAHRFRVHLVTNAELKKSKPLSGRAPHRGSFHIDLSAVLCYKEAFFERGHSMNPKRLHGINEVAGLPKKLVNHPRFTRELAAEIRKPGGLERALGALRREFFPGAVGASASAESWSVLPLVPFDFENVLGAGWGYWRGPLDGDGLSENHVADEDPREQALVEFDTARLRAVLCVGCYGEPVERVEYLDHLKKDEHIRLGPRELFALWSEPHHKTLERLRIEQEVKRIYFFVPLCDPGGYLRFLFLGWSYRGWYYTCSYSEGRRLGSRARAAVLEIS